MNTPEAMVINEEPLASIEHDGRKITLLGTAHISQASADKVAELIATGDYDAIAIELCPSRHQALIDPDHLAKMDLFKVIREGKAALVMTSLALGAFQQRAAAELGIEPGAEMRVAIAQAKQANLPVILIDREISVTLKRIYRNVPWWKRIGLISGLLASIVSREKIDAQEIEKLKQGDMLQSTFTQFAQDANELYTPLIDERDRYMAAKLQQSQATTKHQHVLGVIGAGHLKGMTNYLNQRQISPETIIDELNYIPPKSRWLSYIPWAIVTLVCVGFFIGFSRSPELGWQLVLDWIVINGGLAALGAAIAMAHPITIISAFVAAPLTSLNPAIGAGIVTGAVETYLRKPTVGDFGQLRHDSTSLKGWWKNRVTRILLVFLLSTIGSAAGTYIAGYRIFERLTS